MKKIFNYRVSLAVILILAATNADAQKKQINQDLFTPVETKSVNFVPFKKSDFTKESKSVDELITLPNKKKVKLSDYIAVLNKIEGNLAAIGFSKDRAQKTIIASRFKKANFASPAISVLPKANVKPANATINTKFVSTKIQNKSPISDKLAKAIERLSAIQIGALPNENFDRTFHLTPAPFRNGDYSATLDLTYYLKGELDPFFVASNQMRNDSLAVLVKETSSFYTAGLNLTVAVAVPEVGNITAYKLETEFTARSSRTKKHSSKAKLTVMQQVLINENTPNRTGDATTYRENRLYNVSQLIGAADVFTYGLNLLMPVDFYLNAVGIGADIDVDMDRMGISGSMGPRAAQSIILETSLTELAGPFGEGISNTVDVGVGGELRLIEGGLDYGFSAGLTVNNNRLVFINDMQGEADLELLRGRLFTFYKYPVFTCDNIFLQGLDLSCWEMRRVENDLYNTGAALKFEKTVVNEDKSAFVKW
jgi:hypothetical protein